MEKIKVEMTEEEVKSFVSFRKNQDLFQLLDNAGVFAMRNGKATLNFDAMGGLEEIKIDILRYKRGKPMLQVVSLHA